MGFITTRNRITGREVYSCEANMEGCTDYPCLAHHCPFGWCQRYYICRACWKQQAVKDKFKKVAHEKCRLNMIEQRGRNEERKRLLDDGRYLRVAALDKDEKGVHVIFTNREGQDIGRYMPKEVYRSFDLLANVTLEDFTEKAGHPLEEAPENIYA